MSTKLWEDDEGVEHELPCVWEICDVCGGEGQHAHAVDGNGITASEWADEWDADDRESYMAGHYDSTCDECGGAGKLKVVDLSALSKAMRAQYEQSLQADAEYDAICAAERRMGA